MTTKDKFVTAIMLTLLVWGDQVVRLWWGWVQYGMGHTDWGGVGRGDEPGSDRQHHLDHRLPLLEEDEGAWEGIEAGMALRYDGGTKVKDWGL